MGWDGIIFNFNGNPPDFNNCPNDYKSALISKTRNELINSINKTIKNINWSDPTWGTLDTEDYSIAFSITEEIDIESIGIHIHGNGDPIQKLCELCLVNNWRLYDCSSGDFLDNSHPDLSGWQGFVAYRNRVIDDKNTL